MTTLIIGGGLSGLALADMLEARGSDYVLVEARDRFGGRIMTRQHGRGHFDMGPAWFWAGQPRIGALVHRLGLQTFDQYADGMLTFEDMHGQISRGRGVAPMQGAFRLKGGLASLTDTLAGRLPDMRKRLGARITHLDLSRTGIIATCATGEKLSADRVVLCLPPRIAAGIAFNPALPDAACQAMRDVATWMAGQAKAVAVYDTPFWREAGLSGDAMSRHGPMVEIHDESPAGGEPYALFGFIGLPPDARGDEKALHAHLSAQLGRLFGPQARAPRALYTKDWAADPLTATLADRRPPSAHPTYGLPSALRDIWQGRLIFGGTEVAPKFGGYLEGALEAAEIVLENLPT